MSVVDLFELNTLDRLGVAESLLLSAYPIRPFADTDATRPNARILNRIDGLPSFQQDLYIDASRMIGDVGAGSLTLSNADGSLSYLTGHAMVSLVWYRGSVATDGIPAAFADWEKVGTFRPLPPAPRTSEKDPATLTLSFQDLRIDLDDEVQPNTMTGQAVGNTGHGGSADHKGDPMPLALGDLSTAAVTPPFDNSTNQVWLLSDPAAGAVAAPTALYYRGGPAGLTSVGALGSGLETAALTLSQWGHDLARNLIRTGGNVPADLSVDMMGPAAAGATAPAMIKWLLQRRYGAGVALGPGFSAGLSSAAVGLYVTEAGTSYADLINLLCKSAGLWLCPDEAGVWQIGLYGVPGAPVATIGVNDIIQIEADDGAAPVHTVAVEWGRVYTTATRSNGLAEAQWGTPRESYLAKEWRTASYPDAATTAAIKAKYINATKLPVEQTALRTEAGALALATRLYTMLSQRADGTPRQGWRVAVPLDKWRKKPLGSTLRLQWPAEGLDDPMVLMGRRLCSPDGHLMWLRLWG